MPEKKFAIAWYRFHNGVMMVLGDVLSISAGLCVAAILRKAYSGGTFFPGWGWYVFSLWLGGATLMRIVPSWGLGPVEELRRMTILQIFVHAGTTVALIAGRAAPMDFFTLLTVFFVSSFLIPTVRLRIKRVLIAANRWGVPVVVYGSGETAALVVELLKREKGLGYIPEALVFEAGTAAQQPRAANGVRIEDEAYLAATSAPLAIVAMPGMSRERLATILEGKLSGFYRVMVIPELFDVPSLWVKPRDINGILGLEITSNLLSPFARFIKRAIDIILVLFCAPVWLPLCAATALAIWIKDRGNPFFLQERVGRKGVIFRTWKFRTMVPNAEEVLRQKLDQDEALRFQWLRNYKIKNDPRVTRLGKLLRRLSIDELPQLLNVLRGEMSLVGPRPLPLYHHKKLSPRVRELRERVRPGLTGLWQVSGRSDRPHEDMERLDSYYVRNWSPWLDMVVLVRTFRAVVKGEGAY